MKKIFKLIFVLIGILLLLAIVTVVVIGISIWDTTDRSDPEILENPRDLTELINEYAYDAVNRAKATEQISLLLTEKQLNTVLEAVRKEISIPLLKIRSLYAIYNEDGTVSLEGPISFFGFKSLIRAQLSIELDADGTILLDVSDIGLGHLGTNNFIVKNLVIRNIRTDKIEQSLSEAKIYLTLDMSEGIVHASMSKAQTEKTVAELLPDETKDLVGAIADEVLGNEELFRLYFNDDAVIGAKVYLHELRYTQALKYPLGNSRRDMNDVKADMSTLIGEGIVNCENASTVLDFLVRGYEALPEEEQKVISSLSFLSVGIRNAKDYNGIVNRSDLTMLKVFMDAAVTDPGSLVTIVTKGYYDITVTEENLNELLSSLDFIGTSFGFIKGQETAAISIVSLYADLSDDALTVYLVLDVDGICVYCTASASTEENRDALVTLRIDSLKLGTMAVTDEARHGLLQYLSKVLEVDFLSVDPDHETMSLDFSAYLKGTFIEYLQSQNFANVSVALKSSNGGEIAIRLSKQ